MKCNKIISIFQVAKFQWYEFNEHIFVSCSSRNEDFDAHTRNNQTVWTLKLTTEINRNDILWIKWSWKKQRNTVPMNWIDVTFLFFKTEKLWNVILNANCGTYHHFYHPFSYIFAILYEWALIFFQANAQI